MHWDANSRPINGFLVANHALAGKLIQKHESDWPLMQHCWYACIPLDISVANQPSFNCPVKRACHPTQSLATARMRGTQNVKGNVGYAMHCFGFSHQSFCMLDIVME